MSYDYEGCFSEHPNLVGQYWGEFSHICRDGTFNVCFEYDEVEGKYRPTTPADEYEDALGSCVPDELCSKIDGNDKAYPVFRFDGTSGDPIDSLQDLKDQCCFEPGWYCVREKNYSDMQACYQNDEPTSEYDEICRYIESYIEDGRCYYETDDYGVTQVYRRWIRNRGDGPYAIVGDCTSECGPQPGFYCIETVIYGSGCSGSDSEGVRNSGDDCFACNRGEETSRTHQCEYLTSNQHNAYTQDNCEWDSNIGAFVNYKLSAIYASIEDCEGDGAFAYKSKCFDFNVGWRCVDIEHQVEGETSLSRYIRDLNGGTFPPMPPDWNVIQGCEKNPIGAPGWCNEDPDNYDCWLCVGGNYKKKWEKFAEDCIYMDTPPDYDGAREEYWSYDYDEWVAYDIPNIHSNAWDTKLLCCNHGCDCDEDSDEGVGCSGDGFCEGWYCVKTEVYPNADCGGTPTDEYICAYVFTDSGLGQCRWVNWHQRWEKWYLTTDYPYASKEGCVDARHQCTVSDGDSGSDMGPGDDISSDAGPQWSGSEYEDSGTSGSEGFEPGFYCVETKTYDPAGTSSDSDWGSSGDGTTCDVGDLIDTTTQCEYVLDFPDDGVCKWHEGRWIIQTRQHFNPYGTNNVCEQATTCTFPVGFYCVRVNTYDGGDSECSGSDDETNECRYFGSEPDNECTANSDVYEKIDIGEVYTRYPSEEDCLANAPRCKEEDDGGPEAWYCVKTKYYYPDECAEAPARQTKTCRKVERMAGDTECVPYSTFGAYMQSTFTGPYKDKTDCCCADNDCRCDGGGYGDPACNSEGTSDENEWGYYCYRMYVCSGAGGCTGCVATTVYECKRFDGTTICEWDDELWKYVQWVRQGPRHSRKKGCCGATNACDCDEPEIDPCPDTLTVKVSGIQSAGSSSCTTIEDCPNATWYNKTYILKKQSECEYELSDYGPYGTVSISVILAHDGGIGSIFMFCYYAYSAFAVNVGTFTTVVERGKTYNNTDAVVPPSEVCEMKTGTGQMTIY